MEIKISTFWRFQKSITISNRSFLKRFLNRSPSLLVLTIGAKLVIFSSSSKMP